MKNVFKTIKNGVAPAALLYSGIIGPVILSVALGATVLAVRQGVELAKPKATPKVVVQKEYLAGDKLAAIVVKMQRDNPGVEIRATADGKAILVTGKVIDAYNDWIYALATTSDLEKGYFWESSIICMKDCPSNASMSAQISAFKQLIYGG